MNRVALFLLLISLSSCGEDFAFKDEKKYVSEESLDWLSRSGSGSVFIVADNNGIHQSFQMVSDRNEFGYSSTSYFGIRTKITRRESYYQDWNSWYGRRFSMLLSAAHEPFGDDLSVSLDDFSFSYDLKYKTISRLYTPYGTISKLMTSEGYEENEGPLESTVSEIDSLVINGVLYEGVIEFQLEDFRNKWTPLGIKRIVLAKGFGLVEFSLHNGITYTRE